MVITAVAAFLLAYYFVDIALFPNAIKKGFKYPPGKRMKPIDCTSCLSVWICAVLLFFPAGVSEIILTLFGAGFLGHKIK